MLDRIKILECMYGLQGNPEYMSKILKGHSSGNNEQSNSNKIMSQNQANSNERSLSTKAIAENILKIKINDQEYE